MNLSLLIHTFDGYKHLWQGCIDGWMDINYHVYPRYLGTDVRFDESEFRLGDFQPLYSGQGEWSDRLRHLLHKIDTEYVLYAQEDHWPDGEPPNMMKTLLLMDNLNLKRLQLSPVNQFYSLHGSYLPLFFHPKSKYLVSHQPSIWKKSFLLECLKPGETPWQNEYEGTKRLNARTDLREKIAIYPCDWYKHKCIKGKVIET